VRTANKDKDYSQLNQYLFKIPADFPIQCSDACLALHCEKTSRTPTSIFRTMHQRPCHWEATLAGCSRQSCRTDKRNKVSVVLPAMTLDNSDDKPRQLPLYMNSVSSCLSYVPRGIASVTSYC